MKKKFKKPDSEDRKESIPKEEKSKAYKAILRFVLIFIGLLILIILLFTFTADKLLSAPIVKLEIVTTHLVGLVLNLLGMGANVKQQSLSLPNFSFEVIPECTGLYETFIFLAAILAYPANFKKKLWGALLGIPFIFLVNILRMVTIAIISNYRPETFEILHLYFWQVGLILIILCAWILWIDKIVKSAKFN
ncbi:MAG TPA: exosortase/archaeosortase family protein [Terriglobales bacterium]|nr:exosortase/archaeosortase family protein [Terriglobales bacterium]